MKRTTTAFCSLALTLFFAQSTAWSQLPQQQYYGGYNMPAAQSTSYLDGIMQASYIGGGEVPAVDYGCAAGGCDDPCGGACGGTCDGNCRPGFFDRCRGGWLDVEYLLWWNDDRYIPALATTSPPGTPIAVAGALGQPTTSVVIGDGLVGDGPYSGVRVSGGKWLDEPQTLGLGSRFFIVDGDEDFSVASNASGEPIFARPFFNADPLIAREDALLVAYPGISHGRINVTAENQALGFDLFFRKLLLTGYGNRFDLIGGYQYSRVKDSTRISNSLIVDAAGDPRVPLGSQVDTTDYFEVKNEFNGGFVGLMASAEDGRLSWNLLAKVAAGNMNQQSSISGSTTTDAPGGSPATQSFGLLALPTNIGSFDQDEFAVVPELNVSVGYNVSNNFKVTIGYNFIYWSEVALSGNLIDTTINPTQVQVGGLVGPARPVASLQSDGFWYTGLNIGGSLCF